jgi:hypothetical protein
VAFLKIWKVCKDYGMGILSANVAAANLDYVKAGWLVEHGSTQPAVGSPLSTGNPYTAFGTHNTPKIPRAMVRVQPTSVGGFAANSAFEGFGGVVKSVSQVSTGTWVIALDNRLTLFFADPKPVQTTNTVKRFCQSYGATVVGASNGVVIKCYDLQAGDFVLTDYEFSCGIYSYS